MDKRIMTLIPIMLMATMVLAAMGPPAKVDICHLDGHGTYHLISVSERALEVHEAHGDVQPGTTTEGTPYPGLYGSTVTPITGLGDDCSSIDMLKVVSPTMYYGSCGWAGWSCVEPGYPDAVGGGVVGDPSLVCDQGLAEPGVTVGGYTYPVYPHYTFSPPEEGWVASANTGITNVVVYCGP